ncbi:hypothetical protein QQP08_023495 [Theobroma cacao]|nr:hypothetical protein QQP08_023495 [Theobroma cacao]
MLVVETSNERHANDENHFGYEKLAQYFNASDVYTSNFHDSDATQHQIGHLELGGSIFDP